MLYPRTTPPLNLNLLTRTSALTYNLESCTRASRARHYRAGLATERFLSLFIDHPPSYSIIRYSARVLSSLARYAPPALLYRSCLGYWTSRCDNYFFLPLSSLCYPLLLCLLLWLTSNPFLVFCHLALIAPPTRVTHVGTVSMYRFPLVYACSHHFCPLLSLERSLCQEKNVMAPSAVCAVARLAMAENS
jgi:hypothetical protein